MYLATFKLMLSCGSDSFDDLYMNSSTLSVSITGAVRGREKHNIANNIKECTCVAKCISIIKSYALQPQENTRDRCVKMSKSLIHYIYHITVLAHPCLLSTHTHSLTFYNFNSLSSSITITSSINWSNTDTVLLTLCG